MLTVQQFLNLQTFEEMNVVSGHGGLSNIISSVNIMDNPDALDWFSVGELLLTSGYFFKEGTEIQDNVMRQLKTLNCPALCLKPHRYLGTIPENMIALSNELNLPIIELPYGLSFSKITSRVMEELSEKYDSLNRRSLDIHTQFFNISLHGGGLQKISTTLAKLCSSSVMLLDQNWGLLHWTDLSARDYSLADVIPLMKGDTPFPESFRNSFPPEFEKLQKPIVRVLEIASIQKTLQCTILSVYFQSKHYGYIVLCESLKDLDEYSYIALENGAMAFSLERIRSEEVERARNRIRRDFLDELLLGKITSKETLSNLADLHGINLNLDYTAIIFPVTCLDHRKEENLVLRNQLENAKMKKLLKHFDYLALETKESEIIFSRKKQIILLLGTQAIRTSQMKDYAQEMIDRIEEEFPEVTLSAAIGKTVSHISQINESFHQAQETLRLGEGRRAAGFPRVFHFNEFIVQHLLLNNVSQIELRKFFYQALGELHEYDHEQQAALIETLDCLIDHQLNIAETSRALYIHRNTLLYRIEKIESLLQIDLKDAEELLKLQLALKIHHLMDME